MKKRGGKALAEKTVTKGKKKPSPMLKHWQGVAVMLWMYDTIVVNGAYFLALWLRFDCSFSEIPNEYLYAWLKFIPIHTIVSLLVFKIFHLYNSIWQFASYDELVRTMLA